MSPQDRVGGGGPQSIQGLSGQQALWGLLGGTLEPNPATAPLSFQPSHGVWPGPSRKAESSLRQSRLLSNCDAGALGCSSCRQTGPQATTLCFWSHSPDPSPLFSDPENGDMVFPGSTCESEQHEPRGGRHSTHFQVLVICYPQKQAALVTERKGASLVAQLVRKEKVKLLSRV